MQEAHMSEGTVSTIFENIHWVLVLIGLAILVVAIVAPGRLWQLGNLTWDKRRQLILAGVGTVCVASGVALMLLPVEWITTGVKYYELYGDLDRSGKTSFKTSAMTLVFYGGSGRVQGRTTGMVGSALVTWKLEGYHVGDHLGMAISAVPSSNDPNPSGIGTYQLQRISGSYSGMITYWDRCLLSVVHCPVLLSDSQLDMEAAQARWPNLFKGECRRVNLTPDAPGPVVVATTGPVVAATTSCPYASD
jgi:hypothetical protein